MKNSEADMLLAAINFVKSPTRNTYRELMRTISILAHVIGLDENTPMPVGANIREQVDAYIASHNISISDFCRHANISRVSFYKMQNKEWNPRAKTTNKIRAAISRIPPRSAHT